MRNCETILPRLKIHNGGVKPYSIDERDGRHCVTVENEKPLAKLTENDMEVYYVMLRRLNVPKKDALKAKALAKGEIHEEARVVNSRDIKDVVGHSKDLVKPRALTPAYPGKVIFERAS